MPARRSETDVIARLKVDHREFEEIFGQLEQLSQAETDERQRLATQAVIEIVRHSVAEEEYLYPAARKYLPGGDEVAAHEIHEHAESERTMKQLEQHQPTDPRYAELVAQMIDEIRHHVDEEENDLFPKMSEHTDEEVLEDLGREISAAKATAPTRPHPDAPDTPPLNRILAPGVGLVDRARDAVSGRRGR